MTPDRQTQSFFSQLYALGHNFVPSAYFDREMDQLVYIRTSDSYRANRVDAYLTLLWHAYEPRLIGVKIKGFRSVFDHLKDQGLVSESSFVPLCKAIGMLLHLGLEGQDTPRDEETHRFRAKLYRQAEEVVGDCTISESILRAA